jgi:hypothetical protein
MRRSLVDTRPESGTPLDFRNRAWFLATTLSRLEITQDMVQGDMEYFLHNSMKLMLAETGRVDVNMADVPPPLFAGHLQLMLNAWYQVSLVSSQRVFLGGGPRNLSTYGFDFAHMPANGALNLSVVDEACRIFCTRGTQAVLTHAVEVFLYSCVWLALLLGSSSALLAIGVASMLLERRTLVPDMFGYVASMTYNNRYFSLPCESSSGVPDAMSRTRLLWDLTVVISDVSGGRNVGHIAFTAS